MSIKEIKEYCEKTYTYQVKVKVRLKNTQDFMIGTIATIGIDRFYLNTASAIEPQPVPFAFVANITFA